MILVDTSVWIDYFRGIEATRRLSELLRDHAVVTHPWVMGELRLGHLGARRRTILNDLGQLPEVSLQSFSEIISFIENEKLYGSGLSLVDVQLLYTCLVEDCRLWSMDRQLVKTARHYGKEYAA